MTPDRDGEGARAGGPAGRAADPARVPLRELMDDRLLDALLDRSRDAGRGAAADRRGVDARRAGQGGAGAGAGGRADRAPGLRAGTSAAGQQARGTTATAPSPRRCRPGSGRWAWRCRGTGPGSFEPLLVPKRAGRIAGGLDDMIISLYAHGMSVRDILHHLEQVYGTQLSHETVSRITDAVLEEVRAWQSRPLDPVYAVVFLDAIVVKVRDNQVVQNKPAYIAVGIDADGEKHVLGIWLAKTAPGGRHRRGGRPVLGQRHGRPAQPGRAGHPDRLLRRPDRVRGRHHRGVQPHRGAALRGAPDPQRPAAGRPPRRRRRSRRSCARSTPRRPPRPRSTPWPRSRPHRGAASTRRPRRCSRTPGMRSPRSWPSARPSASCSTPPTRSSR